MPKKVLVISTSLRGGSFSESLARAFAEGAESAGNTVEFVTLKGKEIGYCRGCCKCQERGSCIFRDDSNAIVESMRTSDVVVWATPLYYYGMSGQMKTLIDRANCLYSSDYAIRDVYLICTGSDTEPSAIDKTLTALRGWTECLPKTRIAGTYMAGGLPVEASLDGKKYADEVRQMGRLA